MDTYEKAIKEIEAIYDPKRDAVTEKYKEWRIVPDQRSPETRDGQGVRGGIADGAVGGGFTGMGAGVLAAMWVGIPEIAAAGAVLGAGGGAAFKAAHKREVRVAGYNHVLDGAERAEKCYLGARERAAKGRIRVAHRARNGRERLENSVRSALEHAAGGVETAQSWASIDGLLGGSDDH